MGHTNGVLDSGVKGTDCPQMGQSVTKLAGAEGGTRTHTPLLGTDFKSVASAISPPRHTYVKGIISVNPENPDCNCSDPSHERRIHSLGILGASDDLLCGGDGRIRTAE